MAEFDQFGRRIKKKDTGYKLSLFKGDGKRLDPVAVNRLHSATDKLTPLCASTEVLETHKFQRPGSNITFAPPSAKALRAYHLPTGCSPSIQQEMDERAAKAARKRILEHMSAKDRKVAIMEEQKQKRQSKAQQRLSPLPNSLPHLDLWRHERFDPQPKPNVTVYGETIEDQWPPDIRAVPQVTRKHRRVQGGVREYKGVQRVRNFRRQDEAAGSCNTAYSLLKEH
jgi:hypothetical protein